MTNSILRRLPAVFLLGTILAACGGNKPAAVSPGPDALFQRAQTLLSQGKNRQAAQAFGLFIDQHAGDPRMPQALFGRGRAHTGAHEYILATSDFMRVATEYGSDPLARDARMGLCEAYVALSPKPALDQEYTRAAISYCTSFASIYAGTPQANEAELHVAAMAAKLARKAYDNGNFYFRRKAYDAAIVYFNEAVNDFPGTPSAPAALLALYQTYGRLRYAEEQAEARARLLRDYPQSAEARSLAGTTAPADSAAAPATPVAAPVP
jgi:outer membrane protein assembly factor BamD